MLSLSLFFTIVIELRNYLPQAICSHLKYFRAHLLYLWKYIKKVIGLNKIVSCLLLNFDWRTYLLDIRLFIRRIDFQFKNGVPEINRSQLLPCEWFWNFFNKTMKRLCHLFFSDLNTTQTLSLKYNSYGIIAKINFARIKNMLRPV